MENLILSLNVVLPLFVCIALGYVLRRLRMMDDASRKCLNKLCFKVFLPVYLFGSICSTDLTQAVNVRLTLFVTAGILAWYALLVIAVPRIEKENPRRGVMIQAMFRSNFALFGLPVAIALCGENGAGQTAVLVGLVVPIFNVLAVITLEAFRGGRMNPRKMLRGIALNPLIIGSLAGIAVNALGVSLPAAVQKSVTDIGRIATPLSLIVLGAEFTFGKMRGYEKQLTLAVSGKLLFAPLVMLTLGVLFGFRHESLVPVLVVFGSPTAVSSFTMAEQMDGDAAMAAALVVLTTGLSIVTMFLFIFALKTLGFV